MHLQRGEDQLGDHVLLFENVVDAAIELLGPNWLPVSRSISWALMGPRLSAVRTLPSVA